MALGACVSGEKKQDRQRGCSANRALHETVLGGGDNDLTPAVLSALCT